MGSNVLTEMEDEVISEDYSPSNTLIQFDQPIPLLRGPLPAGSSDDPSIGQFLLAFRNIPSWRKAYEETESKIIEQCLAGARAGCAITAVEKCKPPWWKNIMGSKIDLAERERCEEEEMAKCIQAAREPCLSYAKEKCLSAYGVARIASPKQTASKVKDMSLPGCDQEETNFRGSDLMRVSAPDQREKQ